MAISAMSLMDFSIIGVGKKTLICGKLAADGKFEAHFSYHDNSRIKSNFSKSESTKAKIKITPSPQKVSCLKHD
jgi:hypothetical protein